MHAHLVECVREFGPISSFWCFSFERMNGILGNEPTNNRSIELQFMQRFVSDNSHFQLVTSQPDTLEINEIFSSAVLHHACNFHSTRHLSKQLTPKKISMFGFWT